MILDKERGDVKRLGEVLSVFMKYEFGPWVDGASKDHPVMDVLKKLRYYKSSKRLKLSKAERLRKTFEELGPIFIKFGQMISTRADLFRKEYIDELSKLQDNTPAFPWKEAEGILRKGLGKDPYEVFDAIEEIPLNSASLGQVHEAVLKNGERAVIKIQRPRIINTIDQDIRLLRYVANYLLANNPDWGSFNLEKLIDEFDKSVHKEVDYRFEGRYAEIFRENFEKVKKFKVPRIYWEYSSENVLVMEYIDGVNLKYLVAEGDKKRNKTIAKRLADIYLKQLFEDQFFHADPHPSNIFVLPDDTICYLDFGMMKYLDKDFSKNLASILFNMIVGDIEKMMDGLEAAGIVPKNVEREDLYEELRDIHLIYYQSAAEVNIGKGLERVLRLFEKYDMKIPGNYALLIRSFIILEGSARQLDPELDMMKYIKAYLKGSKGVEIFGLNPIGGIKENITNTLTALGKVPESIYKFSRVLSEGSIRLEFKHLDELTRELDRVSNRISASIMLAAMLIGSALIIHAGTINGKIAQLPLIGAFGFLFSLTLGFWMVIRIFRKSGI